MPKCLFKSQCLDNMSKDPIFVDDREAETEDERTEVIESISRVACRQHLQYDVDDIKIYNRSCGYAVCVYPKEKDASGRDVGILAYFEMPGGIEELNLFLKDCEGKTNKFVKLIGRNIEAGVVKNAFSVVGRMYERKRKAKQLIISAAAVGILAGIIYLITR